MFLNPTPLQPTAPRIRTETKYKYGYICAAYLRVCLAGLHQALGRGTGSRRCFKLQSVGTSSPSRQAPRRALPPHRGMCSRRRPDPRHGTGFRRRPAARAERARKEARSARAEGNDGTGDGAARSCDFVAPRPPSRSSHWIF